MSEIKVNSIKGVGASTAAITVNNTDGTCTANLTNRTNRRLTINGDMRIAQRGTSATAEGYQTVDRITYDAGGEDETITQAQVDVASGTTPYTLGFRKAYRLTNGNQTGGAGASDYVQPVHRLEAQDIANSGWNYTSSSSFITLSFWVKSSVAGDYTLNFETLDGTGYRYLMEYTLSADTWTKVTKTIPGNSNLTFNNDNGHGATIMLYPFLGSSYVQADQKNNWYASSNGKYGTTSTTSWWTTNDSTWEMTGLQLEVGSVATDFEHRSFGQELALCQRYFHKIESGSTDVYLNTLQAYGSGAVFGVYYHFPVTMRATPTTTVTGTITPTNSAGNFAGNLSSFTFDRNTPDLVASNNTSGGSGLSAGDAALIALRANTSASISSDAEL